MIGFAETPEAWSRARRMAQTRRLNLAGAVVDGWLNRRELSVLVANCNICHSAPLCADWLTATPTPITLPVFCGNKSLIEALAP